MEDHNFKLENMYQFYLKKVKTKEEDMGPIQRVEMRRAFMGACACMLVVLQEDVGAIEDEMEAVAVLQDMKNQCSDFWLKQSNQGN